MNDPSSRRPPSDRRPARRSLVELTAEASRAITDGLPVAPPNLAPERPQRREQTEQGEPTTAARVAEPKAANSARNARDSSAELTVRIAKEFQARALQDFSLSMNAALDYAKGLFETRAPAGEASRDGPKPGAPVAAGFVTNLGATAQYRAESAELMKANVESTLDYARALASAKTPAEFIALSSEHARKQCEFVVKQTGALKSLARSVTKSSPE